MPGAEILGHGRKAEACVDSAFLEQLDRCGKFAGNPVDIVDGVESNLRCHDRNEQMLTRPQGGHPDGTAFQVGDAPDAVFSEHSKQPTCTPARTVTALPPSITDTHCGAKCKLKSTSSRTTTSLIAAVDALSTYRISVKPSARSRSSTIS